MFKRICPKDLPRVVYRNGPYVIFYNGEGISTNNSLVENVKIFANKYNNLNIYEISWRDQVFFKPQTSLTQLNTIFLYYQGLLKSFKINPNKEDITDIIEEAIILHNMQIEKRVKNIGKFPKYKIHDMKDAKTHEEILKIKKYHIKLNSKKKQVLNKLISSPSQEISQSKNIAEIDSYVKAKKVRVYKKKLSNCKLDKFPQIKKDSKCVNFTMNSSTPWFCDVKISNQLPVDFFQELEPKTTHQNKPYFNSKHSIEISSDNTRTKPYSQESIELKNNNFLSLMDNPKKCFQITEIIKEQNIDNKFSVDIRFKPNIQNDSLTESLPFFDSKNIQKTDKSIETNTTQQIDCNKHQEKMVLNKNIYEIRNMFFRNPNASL